MPAIIGAVVVLLGLLYFSYRQTIAAYPNGGGSYTVAKENLGLNLGLTAAASLILDYVLNVAVAISAGIGALVSAVPFLHPHMLALCLLVLLIITVVNLRGVRESGLVFSIPTYLFTASLLIIFAIGIYKAIASGGHPVAAFAAPTPAAALGSVSLYLLLRAFASGCTAMTGVEAVSNATPLFAEPPARNAQRTLTLICFFLGLLLAAIAYLSHAYHITAMDQEKPGYQSVISQLAGAIVGRGPVYYVTIASVIAILMLSANTSFTGFPRLCRLLADDGFMPNAFANVGRRLVFSGGIITLALISGLILIGFGGITDKLIPLFAVGAFGAFTLSQAGMVMHWKKQRGPHFRAFLVINALGAVATLLALIIIVAAKFTAGAWMTLVLVPGMILLFKAISRHYAKVACEIRQVVPLQTGKVSPLAVVVPIEGWDKVTERAVRFALRISQDITALHVTSEEDNKRLRKRWYEVVEEPARAAGYHVPRLEIVQSPYRQVFQPVLDYVEKLKNEKYDRLVAVVVPELVQPLWWEYLLHNYRALGLKAALFLKGDQRTVVINTPWYLKDDHNGRAEDEDGQEP